MIVWPRDHSSLSLHGLCPAPRAGQRAEHPGAVPVRDGILGGEEVDVGDRVHGGQLRELVRLGVPRPVPGAGGHQRAQGEGEGDQEEHGGVRCGLQWRPAFIQGADLLVVCLSAHIS